MLNRLDFIKKAAALSLVVTVSEDVLYAPPASAATSCFFNTSDTYNLDSNFWQYTLNTESKLTRKFAGFRLNGGFTRAGDPTEVSKEYNYGRRWIYINGKPDAPTATGYWHDVAQGKYDAQFTSFFTRYAGYPLIHYSFHHEQYVASEGGGSQAGTAIEYIAAFRHVRALMQHYHVSNGGNMLMCFTPHWLQFYHDQIVGDGKPTAAVAPFVVSKLDPGTAYYDLLGADIYCTTKQTYTAAQQWTPVYKWAARQGKAFFTGEQGVAGSDTKVVTYLKQLDSLLKVWGVGSGAAQIQALCFTNRLASGGDFRMDSSAARLSQYKSMALDPAYAATV